MNKIDEIKKQLVWKIKDASNTNTIFDTRKYLLYEDVIEILNQALTIPVVSKSVNCDHPRSERSYIGQNMLRCNKCGKEFS